MAAAVEEDWESAVGALSLVSPPPPHVVRRLMVLSWLHVFELHPD